MYLREVYALTYNNEYLSGGCIWTLEYVIDNFIPRNLLGLKQGIFA